MTYALWTVSPQTRGEVDFHLMSNQSHGTKVVYPPVAAAPWGVRDPYGTFAQLLWCKAWLWD